MKLSGFKILPVLALLVAGFCMFSCAEEPRDGMPDRMPLVIEGWIEDGLRPVVIVTRAVDLTRPVGSLDDYVEKWCRVSIADGDRIYYLTGKIDKAYTPSFVFTTSRLHGVAGHTYHLKVETEDTVIEAETRIPASPVIDSFKVVKAGLADTLYQIVAYPHVAEDSPCYYKFFTRVLNYEKRYFSSFLGTFESSGYDPTRGISVARGIHNTYDGESKFTPYYAAGDTVDVKLCSIDSVAYRFWRAYENSVSLSGNPFFTVAEECRGNIPGALGYWFGYGVARRRVIIGR